LIALDMDGSKTGLNGTFPRKYAHYTGFDVLSRDQVSGNVQLR
jgi:hypothetical protein